MKPATAAEQILLIVLLALRQQMLGLLLLLLLWQCIILAAMVAMNHGADSGSNLSFIVCCGAAEAASWTCCLSLSGYVTGWMAQHNCQPDYQ
jgi:hypothetical protein